MCLNGEIEDSHQEEGTDLGYRKEQYSFPWLVRTHPSAPLSQANSKLNSLPPGGQAGGRQRVGRQGVQAADTSQRRGRLCPLGSIFIPFQDLLSNFGSVQFSLSQLPPKSFCWRYIAVTWNVDLQLRLLQHNNSEVDGPGQSRVALPAPQDTGVISALIFLICANKEVEPGNQPGPL